jgi:hypothetical protein
MIRLSALITNMTFHGKIVYRNEIAGDDRLAARLVNVETFDVRVSNRT